MFALCQPSSPNLAEMLRISLYASPAIGRPAMLQIHTRKLLLGVPCLDTGKLLRDRVDIFDLQSDSGSMRPTHHAPPAVANHDGRVAEHPAEQGEHLALEGLANRDNQSQRGDANEAAQHHETRTQLVTAHGSNAVAD